MASLFISAAHKSSGKTTVSIGLCAALKNRGHHVQPFKKGPDYIDPIWLGMAAQQPCFNLDYYISGEQGTISEYLQHSQEAEICLIEGNKGLHDGLNLDGSNSNAALARALEAPVILVIDSRGITRGIAPLLLGYQAFDPEVRIAGVIANQTGGDRHVSKLRAAVEYYTDIPFLGALPSTEAVAISEEHLGLVPGNEDPGAISRIKSMADAIEQNLDLNQLLKIAAQAGRPTLQTTAPEVQPLRFDGLKIGVLKDEAFAFYYPGDLQAFRNAGAELVFINSLQDSDVPLIDGLFVGGGFPERHAEQLSSNRALQAAIYQAIEGGLPAYVECGGLMYLSSAIVTLDGGRLPMAGVIPAETRMHKKPVGRGYISLQPTDNHPWPFSNAHSDPVKAHEFHYSSLEGDLGDSLWAYEIKRGFGIDGSNDGIVYKNLLANYAHLRHTLKTPWVSHFLNFVASQKSN